MTAPLVGQHVGLSFVIEEFVEHADGTIEIKKMRPLAAGIGRHGWMITASGRQFYPSNPRPEDICIEDIAHALSHVCRFGGHVRFFYSVAQHSLLVSRLLPERLALAGLLHDAPEAYIGDMVRPLKEHMPMFAAIEDSVWFAVCKRFGIEPPSLADWEEIKRADNVALVTERRDLLPEVNGSNWKEDEQGYQPDPEPVLPMTPERARWLFARRFCELTSVGGGGW